MAGRNKGDKKLRLSIGKKTAILMTSVVLLVSIVAMIISNYISRSIIEKLYTERSIDLASSVAVTVDGDKLKNVRDAVLEIYKNCDNVVTSEDWGSDEFYAYLAQYSQIEEMPEFIDIRDGLRKMLDTNHVESVYITYMDKSMQDGYLYLVDAAYEDMCPPGCMDPFFSEEAKIALTRPELGVPPTISDSEEYGWIIATGMPIYDSNNEFVGFAAVDLSMNDIRDIAYDYYKITVVVMLALAAVICLIGIALVRRLIVKPINVLSETSKKYYDEETLTHHKFSQLDIHTGDELELLANSMKQMESDLNEQIKNLLATTKKLESTREAAKEMSTLANIDALTRVRNKRAFDSQKDLLNSRISSGDLTEFGIAMIDMNGLKTINDTYGHDKGDIAIQTLCHRICESFKHSPVFRVGGHEFVAILEKQDFAASTEVFASFNNGLESGSEDGSKEVWERINAAYGYAVFDPKTDKDVDDVLKRADDDMYERKKIMKRVR